MSYIVDYSNDHQFVDGVTTGTYTPPSGGGQPVNVKRGTLNHTDIQGGVFGVSPGDVPFTVWGITGDAEVNGTLTVGSTTYMVIQVAERSDEAHQRLICREQV